MPRRTDRPLLICPRCEADSVATPRLGNRKSACPLCNRFAQAVRRRASSALMRKYPRAYTRERTSAEADVYADLLAAGALR